MSRLCYYNGQWGNDESILIPLSDRALYFGDGVYDLAVGENGRVSFIDEHIERLLFGARELGMLHSYTHDALSAIIHEAVKRAEKKRYTVYFQLTRSASVRRHSAKNLDGVNLLIIVDDAPTYKSEDISLITLPDLRYSYCYIKTLNLLPSVIASTKADEVEADEAVLCKDGFITECAHSNVFIINDGKIITRGTDGSILPGITRAHLLSTARRLSIPTEERRFTLAELYSADEIIVTSTTRVMSRAVKIDGISVGGRATDLYSLLRNSLVRTV